MKLTIELPESVTVKSGDAETEFRWDKLPKESIADFVADAACIGVAKAGNDSASGAKAYAAKSAESDDQETVDTETARGILIEKWCNARYESGTFGRVAGIGLSAVDREMISIMRPKVKGLLGDKAYKELDDPDATVLEHIASLTDEQREGLMKFAQDEIDRKAAVKARREAFNIPGLDI